MNGLTGAVARAIRDPGGLPLDLPAGDVIAEASHHRVFLLLGWMLRAAGRLDAWPAEFVDAFRRAERDALFVDCFRQAELARLLGELDAAGVRALLFKGSALAFTCYPSPHVRPRADTDLLVPSGELPALDALLARLGYVRPLETSGQLVSYQSHYQRTDRHGVTHALDVHWKISNFQAFADRFDHADLWEHRAGVEALGPAAATVDAVDALLLALVHRAGHHSGSTNLLWLYDFHLLQRGLTEAQQQRFDERAAAKGLTRVVAEGLSLAEQWFGDEGKVPAQDQRPWTQAEVLSFDLRALGDWRSRVRLVKEHLLPAPSYMRAKYGLRTNAALPVFYAWRVMRGMPKWFRVRSV